MAFSLYIPEHSVNLSNKWLYLKNDKECKTVDSMSDVKNLRHGGGVFKY